MTQPQDLPTILLKRQAAILRDLVACESSAMCRAYIYPWIAGHARRVINANGLMNILLEAYNIYVKQYCAMGMNAQSARAAGQQIVHNWAEVLIPDQAVREDTLKRFDQVAKQPED